MAVFINSMITYLDLERYSTNLNMGNNKRDITKRSYYINYVL